MGVLIFPVVGPFRWGFVKGLRGMLPQILGPHRPYRMSQTQRSQTRPEDTLSPKHCSHHGQRPSPTPHLHPAFQISTRIPAATAGIFCGGLDRNGGCPQGSQTQSSRRRRLEECSFRDSLSKRLSV
ncbi:hypothetical protein EYF80_039033 [Liparis tanakae]|uniref:Uncharacterized protein n=1 Tax=Liparis tanakae TaxID=230148 RepID=A0A4Z2GB09_9TELE|nr:hypothetical protein EYF80_039033 [Liparis tanakae]